MTITLNGEVRDLVAETDLAALVESLSLPAQRLAVELNGKVIRRGDWPKTIVHDSDRIEVVQFVGGG